VYNTIIIFQGLPNALISFHSPNNPLSRAKRDKGEFTRINTINDKRQTTRYNSSFAICTAPYRHVTASYTFRMTACISIDVRSLYASYTNVSPLFSRRLDASIRHYLSPGDKCVYRHIGITGSVPRARRRTTRHDGRRFAVARYWKGVLQGPLLRSGMPSFRPRRISFIGCHRR